MTFLMVGQGYQHWLGKPWSQTVTTESRNKVASMLRETGTGKGSRWRHLNQFAQDGSELPLSYSLIRIPAAPGKQAHAIAFGRDLRPQAALQQKLISAQRSMERDYWQLKHIETRYRLLSQVTSEALLILDAASEKLEDSNPAALALFGEALSKSAWSLRDSLEQRSYTELSQVFSGLRASGRSVPLEVRLAPSGADMVVSVSLFRQEQSSHFLLRLVPKAAQQDTRGTGNAKQRVTSVRAPRGAGAQEKTAKSIRPGFLDEEELAALAGKAKQVGAKYAEQRTDPPSAGIGAGAASSADIGAAAGVWAGAFKGTGEKTKCR